MTFPQDFLNRAKSLLGLDNYKDLALPIVIKRQEMECPFERQYILRMMVANPDSNGFQIPSELDWLRSTILECAELQKKNGLANPYVYVTVRHGLVTSETDDSWHVDGFSLRIPHTPEQNYLWSNTRPTEYQDKPFPLPADFDAFRHNLHNYLVMQADDAVTRQCDEKTIYLFDPYFVHRRPKFTSNFLRTFWRISFIPVEIEDDTCTQNPLLSQRIYGRTDVRKTLIDYGTEN